MAEAILLRNLPEWLGEVHVWKKYTLQENINYIWNRYDVVTTVTYKWEKWNAVTTYTWNKYTNVQSPSYTEKNTSGYIGGFSAAASYDPPSNPVLVAYAYSMMPQVNIYNGAARFTVTYWHNNNYTISSKLSDKKLSVSPAYGVSGYVYEYGSGTSRVTFYESLYRVTSVRSYTSNYYPSEDDYSFNIYLNYDKQYIPYIANTAGALQGSVSSQNVSEYPNGNLHTDGFYYGDMTSSTSKGTTSYGQVTSTNSSAYPSNGASGSYWYVSAGSDTSYSKGSTSYPDVSSTSDSAYPNPGHQDGYWYENRQQVITHSMGSYIEDVFSTNPQRYPTNGIDGAYWYVLQS